MKLRENISSKQVISCLVILVLVLALGINVYAYENRFKAKQEVVILEYGESLSKDYAEYIDANKEIIKKTALDVSELDNMKEGTYQVTASYQDKKVSFRVEVKDTVKPEVMLLNDGKYTCVAGKDLLAVSIVEKMEDKAGIQSVAFEGNQTAIETDSENLLDNVGVKYEEAGTYENKVIVTDANGNKQEKAITIEVVEDYLAHVSGFKDITVEQGTSVDWLADIQKDERVVNIEADASNVKIDTPGTYELVYKIHGDDGKTVVEKKVNVSVIAPVVTFDSSSGGSYAGGTSKGSRGGGSSSGHRGNSSNNNGSSSGSTSGGNGSSGGHKAGDSWTSETDSWGFVGGGTEGDGGNTSESGSFDW